MLWSVRAHCATSQDIKTCYKPNQTEPNKCFSTWIIRVVFYKRWNQPHQVVWNWSWKNKIFETCCCPSRNRSRMKPMKPAVAFQELDHLWNRPANRSGCPRGPRTPSPRGRSRSSWTWSCPASRPRGRSSAASPSSTCSAPLRFFGLFGRIFDNLTLKIPNRFSAILAKKPQKAIIDCAAFSSTCTINMYKNFWNTMIYYVWMTAMINLFD